MAVSQSNPVVGTELDPEVTVEVGDIQITDNDAKYNLPDPAPSIWTDYMVKNQYEQDYHRYMMGMTTLAGFQGNKVAFVQLASPTLLWICRWTACRWNKHPDVPSPDPADTNWIFLDRHIEPVMITLARDGVTPLYRVNGVYVYGHKNPDADITPYLTHPRPPWMQDVFDRSVPASSFTGGLITKGKPAPTLGGGEVGKPGRPTDPFEIVS